MSSGGEFEFLRNTGETFDSLTSPLIMSYMYVDLACGRRAGAKMTRSCEC